MQVVLDAVTMARNVRQESGLGPRAPVAVDLVTQDQAVFEMLGRHAGLIARLAVLSSASRATGAGYSAPRLSGMQSNGVLDVVVHLAGLIDVDKEKARLLREIEKAQKDKAGLEKRFANEEFVKRAPPEVVEEGRVNLRALDEKVARLTAALGRLS